ALAEREQNAGGGARSLAADLAALEQRDALPLARERECHRAADDAAPDDHRVGRTHHPPLTRAISVRSSSAPRSSPTQRRAIRPPGSTRKVTTTWSIAPSAPGVRPTPQRVSTACTSSAGPPRKDQVARSAPRSCA